MPEGDGREPIADDEILFRRVSDRSGVYDPASDRPIAWVAFRPNARDIEGLSVWRAKYKSAEKAAAEGARPGRRYLVLGLRADRLRAAGVLVQPSPAEGGPGLASLGTLNIRTYRENKDSIRELAERIANSLVEDVQGPFGPFATAES